MTINITKLSYWIMTARKVHIRSSFNRKALYRQLQDCYSMDFYCSQAIRKQVISIKLFMLGYESVLNVYEWTHQLNQLEFLIDSHNDEWVNSVFLCPSEDEKRNKEESCFLESVDLKSREEEIPNVNPIAACLHSLSFY